MICQIAVSVNGLFEPKEEKMKCKKCGYKDMHKQPVFELYNKNGEFVEGYGHGPVMITTDIEYICKACGFNQSRPLSNIVLPNPVTVCLAGSGQN